MFNNLLGFSHFTAFLGLYIPHSVLFNEGLCWNKAEYGMNLQC